MENKYKVTNLVTKESHLCSKISINQYDYYVSHTRIIELKPDDSYYTIVENPRRVVRYSKHISDINSPVIICTTDPKTDIPKVVDKVEKWLEIFIDEEENEVNSNKEYNSQSFLNGVRLGYNKSKETHPFSKEDMIDFLKFYKSYILMIKENGWEEAETSEDRILEVWKENKPIKIYFK